VVRGTLYGRNGMKRSSRVQALGKGMNELYVLSWWSGGVRTHLTRHVSCSMVQACQTGRRECSAGCSAVLSYEG